MSVIENIKSIRIEKAIAQKYLADELEVDVSAISNIENGKRELKVSELEKIAKCLNVNIIDLFTYPVKYVPSSNTNNDIEAVIQIKLNDQKKIEVLKTVFGDNLDILTK